jgi:hypothetical protein
MSFDRKRLEAVLQTLHAGQLIAHDLAPLGCEVLDPVPSSRHRFEL